MSKDYMAEYHRWLDAGACEPIDDEKEITIKKAIIIGFWQCLAMMPGI